MGTFFCCWVYIAKPHDSAPQESFSCMMLMSTYHISCSNSHRRRRRCSIACQLCSGERWSLQQQLQLFSTNVRLRVLINQARSETRGWGRARLQNKIFFPGVSWKRDLKADQGYTRRKTFFKEVSCTFFSILPSWGLEAMPLPLGTLFWPRARKFRVWMNVQLRLDPKKQYYTNGISSAVLFSKEVTQVCA